MRVTGETILSQGIFLILDNVFRKSLKIYSKKRSSQLAFKLDGAIQVTVILRLHWKQTDGHTDKAKISRYFGFREITYLEFLS